MSSIAEVVLVGPGPSSNTSIITAMPPPSFRPIRPSSSRSQDTKRELLTSAGASSAAYEETEPHQSQPAIVSSVAVGKARRRKTPSHVSSNACKNCKKARAKCDGSEPEPCTRCITRGIIEQCNYEVHVKTAKEELVRKVKQQEITIATLNEIINNMKGDYDHVKNILEGIAKLENPTPETIQFIVDELQKVPMEQFRQSSSTSLESNESGQYTGSDVEMASPGSEEPQSEGLEEQRWTSVTTDDPFVDHLMWLYFTWVHPIHMLFSEHHFLEDFKNKNSKYCSPSLVNAICAMGCCFLADEHGSNADAKNWVERFSRQVRMQVEREKEMTTTSAVVYAVLFLVELSAGQARKAYSHLRLAVELLREVGNDSWAEDALEITTFGVHTLNTVWAAFSYQMPAAPVSPDLEIFEQVQIDRPYALWRAYTIPTDAGKGEQTSYAVETAKEFAKLSQIIHQTIAEWCGRHGRVTAHGLLRLYQRYLSWKQELPAHLSHPEIGMDLPDGPLAHLFSIHIHYNVAICQLFAPLIEFPGFPPMARDHVRDVVTQSATEGLKMYSQYREVFTNRYQPPFQSFSLVHLCDMLLRHGPKPDVNQVVRFCLETLGEGLPGFPCAGPLQAMFCESVLGCGHQLPLDVGKLMGGKRWQSFSREDKLDCCERLTYAQPCDMLVEKLDPEINSNFESEWIAFIENHGSEEGSTVKVRTGDDDDEERQSNTSNAPATQNNNGPQAMAINSLMNPS